MGSTELSSTLTVKPEQPQFLLTLGMPAPFPIAAIVLGLAIKSHVRRIRLSRNCGKNRGRINTGVHVFLTTDAQILDRRIKRFNFFAHKDTMSFWSQTAAAPSFMQIMGWGDRSPHYLRTVPPLPPSAFLTLSDGRKAGIKRLFRDQCAKTAAFLEAHYCAPDWRITNVASWIDSYLRDIDVVALGLFVGDSELVGTIFATPLSSGTTVMSHGASLSMMRIIEGLCVHSRYRGDGVAAFLIKHMDSFVAFQLGTCAYLFSRELPAVPYFNSALRCDTYAYKICGQPRDSLIHVESLPWSVFERMWTFYCWAWTAGAREEGCIVATLPQNRRGKLAVYTKDRLLAVVSNTERVGSTGNAIYEVVWCGAIGPGQSLMPNLPTLDFQQLLNGVAGLLPAGAVLFASSGLEGGGVTSAWPGWIVGASGVHAWYIYNYMPPLFGKCRIHAIRDEL